MRACPSCSAANSDASKFCSECGAALSPDYAVTVMGESRAEGQGAREESDASSFSDTSHHGRFLPGTKIADRYRIVSLAGKGGMGEVYRADDLKLGHTVALKFLPRDLAQDPQRLEYFHSEVRLTRQISHPNVCRVYDIGEFEDQPFLSMEYVDGEDLRGLLRRIGRLPRDKGVEIARQLCAGLAAAHDKGVLHRDLKPANIMLDGRGQVRITDFGLAKLAEDGAEREVAGTPAYMAPEQLARGETTIQSDLYSLGLILHEIFTGEAVHTSNSIPELLQQHQESSISEPSALVDDMDPVVERVIIRCLRKEAHERPKSVREVAAALPGGDPLLAALAAGETPSPEMVAAAGDDTGVDRRFALGALVGVGAFLLLNLWLADRVLSVQQLELKHPEALRAAAENLAQGFDDENDKSSDRESIYGFWAFPELNDGNVSFWYRARVKTGFDTNAFWMSRWGIPARSRPDFFLPAWEEPEEFGAVLSGDGRLLYFRAAPKEFLRTENGEEPTSGNSGGDEPTQWFDVFRPMLSDVDLEKAELLDAWTPPDPYDEVGVWRGVDPEGSTFRVEAAAFRERPTYFIRLREFKSEPDQESNPDQTHDLKLPTRFGAPVPEPPEITIQYGFHAILLAAGIVLAWQNLRLGRGDRRGGRRLAAYVFALNLIVLLCYGRHSLDIGSEVRNVVIIGVSQALFFTAEIWVWYMALEPHVRRVWPQILITSSRLLDGRIRDRLVGRDLLAGTLCGVIFEGLWRVNILVQAGLQVHPPGSQLSTLTLAGVRELLGSVFAMHWLGINYAIQILMLLLVCRIVVRSERRAVVASVIMLIPIVGSIVQGDLVITGVVTAVHCSVLLLLLVRFGVLALVVQFLAQFLCGAFPLTFDTSRWYFGHGMFAVALVAAIAVYGFYTSQGGRRVFSTAAIRAS